MQEVLLIKVLPFPEEYKFNEKKEFSMSSYMKISSKYLSLKMNEEIRININGPLKKYGKVMRLENKKEAYIFNGIIVSRHTKKLSNDDCEIINKNLFKNNFNEIRNFMIEKEFPSVFLNNWNQDCFLILSK